MNRFRKPFLARRMDAIAERLADAWCPEQGWQWAHFDDLVSAEIAVEVRTILTDSLTSGEVSGAALRSDCGRRAFLAVPSTVSQDHAIHVAAHEAWHLIANHDGCADGPGELEAEGFADRVGTRIRTRRRGKCGQWAVALGAY